ncbi:MAG: hypothetical protein ABIF09_06735 [Gemmatimonadota bacterium]
MVKRSEHIEMANRRVVKRERKRVPEYTVRGCPLTKSRSLWCHSLCVSKDGIGLCGRLAPHTVTGRTQIAILKHKIKQQQARRDSAEL